MSVDAGKVVLRFEIDITQFEQAIAKAKSGLVDFKGGAQQASKAVEEVGKESTTTAVRFLTLTQGVLNLTTSFTQAYTSISNLQRAKTSLQAAAVGLERAEDQLERKQFRLNQEMKRAEPNLEKIRLLTNEIATAEDDLQVKTQRLKDEQDRVNDTYVLFALNLTNVAFSGFQTIKMILELTKGVKLLSIQSGILNAITSKWTLIALAAIAAYEGVIQVLKASGAEWASQYSIIDNVNKLMDDFSHSQDITLKNYGRNLEDAGNALQGFAQKESGVLGSSNVKFNKWATERYEKVKILIDAHDRLAAAQYGLTAGNFQ